MTGVVTSAITDARSLRRDMPARWMHSAFRDATVALCWVPFAVMAHVFENAARRGDGSALKTMLAIVLMLSFAHQPITLPLIYGDRGQFNVRRGLFTWSPVVFIAVITFGLYFAMGLVAAVAGLWNAEHTLMQRFGLTRIYGRKVGEASGRLERTMLQGVLVLTLVWIAADSRTPRHASLISIGSINQRGIDMLQSYRSIARWLLVPVVLAVVSMVVAWVRRERVAALASRANPAKWLYVGSTAALFGVMLIDPIAGFVAYVAAHALEYYAVVHSNMSHRGGIMRAVPRSPIGRWIVLGAFGVACVVGIRYASNHLPFKLYLTIFLLIGGLHVFYDGFIWKLKRPAVAASFGVTSGATREALFDVQR